MLANSRAETTRSFDGFGLRDLILRVQRFLLWNLIFVFRNKSARITYAFVSSSLFVVHYTHGKEMLLLSYMSNLIKLHITDMRNVPLDSGPQIK